MSTLLEELVAPSHVQIAVGQTITILLEGVLKGVLATILEVRGPRCLIVQFQRRTLTVRKSLHGQWEEVL